MERWEIISGQLAGLSRPSLLERYRFWQVLSWTTMPVIDGTATQRLVSQREAARTAPNFATSTPPLPNWPRNYENKASLSTFTRANGSI